MLGNLYVEMKIQKITQAQLAQAINNTTRAVSNKLLGKRDFTSSEMFAIQKAFFPEKNLEYLFAKVE